MRALVGPSRPDAAEFSTGQPSASFLFYDARGRVSECVDNFVLRDCASRVHAAGDNWCGRLRAA
ncbi:hypothetical protein HK28_07710 [Acetobacter sp. DsW_063]|nr:hypothetical protein HK28_07710 [Acetobacter sp. DsW_063]